MSKHIVKVKDRKTGREFAMEVSDNIAAAQIPDFLAKTQPNIEVIGKPEPVGEKKTAPAAK